MSTPKKGSILKKLKSKYRLVILNNDTLASKASWNLTPMNVFVAVGIFLISFTFLLTYVIAFTPLKEYIPGYADVNMQRQLRKLVQQTEDLQKELDARAIYIKNIEDVVNGKAGKGDISDKPNASNARYDSIKAQKELPRSPEDEQLRKEIDELNKKK